MKSVYSHKTAGLSSRTIFVLSYLCHEMDTKTRGNRKLTAVVCEMMDVLFFRGVATNTAQRP